MRSAIMSGQLHGRDRREGHRRDVREAGGLLLHGVGDFRAPVTGIDDPEAGDAVEVGVAIDVVERAAFAAIKDVQAVPLSASSIHGTEWIQT